MAVEAMQDESVASVSGDLSDGYIICCARDTVACEMSLRLMPGCSERLLLKLLRSSSPGYFLLYNTLPSFVPPPSSPANITTAL